MGRLLTEQDDRAGAAPVAVVSHRFWMEKLSASALGREPPRSPVPVPAQLVARLLGLDR